MRAIFSALWDLLIEASPYLVLGFALAGVIHVFLARFPRVTAQLTGPGRRPVFMAALIGAPMPLCSCSVLPAAMALRRQGAGKGTTASFLVSVPETDIVSVLVTLALIGPFVAVYRPLAAVAGALVIGLVVRAVERRYARHPAPASPPPGAPIGAASGCNDGECAEPRADAGRPREAATVAPWWVRALRYGFVEIFDDIAPQLFLGIVLAAIIGALLPDVDPALVRAHALFSYAVMVLVGIPLYVCAAASTPIAASLIAGGVSPGAAMVFLLAGPATNLGSLSVLRAEFGTRILAVYVVMIALTSIALGALLDLVVGPLHVSTATAHAGAATSVPRVLCTVAFAVWIAVSFRRSRLLPRLRGNLVRMAARGSLRS